MRLIDADALEKDANDDLFNWPDTVEEVYWNDGAKSIIDLIKTAPTIDPVKHGKWMPHPEEPDFDICSVCGIGCLKRTHGYSAGGFWDAEESYDYCPNCGAQMERSEE